MPGNFLEDDLREMMDPEEFGTVAIFIPKGGVAQAPIDVIFDEGYTEIDPETGDVETIPPTITAVASDLPGISHLGTIQIDGTDFQVLSFEIVQKQITVALRK